MKQISGRSVALSLSALLPLIGHATNPAHQFTQQIVHKGTEEIVVIANHSPVSITGYHVSFNCGETSSAHLADSVVQPGTKPVPPEGLGIPISSGQQAEICKGGSMLFCSKTELQLVATL